MLALMAAVGGPVTAQPTPACVDPAQPGPWFRLLRADERFCDREPTDEDPAWFALKNVATGDVRWSLGGELRGRVEHYSSVRAGLRGGTADGYVMYRGLVHVDARVTPQWRVFGEMGYWNSRGREPAPSPTDVNRGDISQLFVEWTGANGASVRAGRQQVLFGSGRLIGIRHAPNLRLDFDGVRVGLPSAGGQLDVFHLRPVDIRPGSFNDREDSRERVAGVYWTRPGTLGPLGLDVYAFRFERGFQRYQNGAGEDRRTVLGARVFGRYGRFTANTELTLQDGSVGSQDARAWSLQSDTQWRARPDARWALGLKTSQASGDDDPDDGRVGTFEPIYAAPPYLMQSALFFPANLSSLQPYLEWSPAANLTVVVEAQGHWRKEEEDGYYAPPMIVTRLDERGRFLGTQFGVSLRYLPRRDIALDAWASRLRVAGPLERAGAEDTTFFATMATWSF